MSADAANEKAEFKDDIVARRRGRDAPALSDIVRSRDSNGEVRLIELSFKTFNRIPRRAEDTIGPNDDGKVVLKRVLDRSRNLKRFRGNEVKSTGDGILATFDGPARGVRCACSIAEEIRPLGINVRAGLHTGECEMIGDDVGGIAVHIGARVAALAGADEVLVSSTVKDLVAGSGLRFADRGSRSLKGIPGEWHIYAVEQ